MFKIKTFLGRLAFFGFIQKRIQVFTEINIIYFLLEAP